MEFDPVEGVPHMIGEVLAMAETWPGWNGTPVEVDGRVMTPHKAIRRVGDHVIDHLAEIQARISGEDSLADNWHNSTFTTAADLAPFDQNDLNEARERLVRLAQLWRITMAGVPAAKLDEPVDNAMTLRELAEHTVESLVYGQMIGALN